MQGNLRRTGFGLAAAFFASILLLSGCGAGAKTASPAPSQPAAKSSDQQAQPAQPAQPPTIQQLAMMKGPDRERWLIEGAKKEGHLTWYTTYIAQQLARPLADAFQKKYPFIKVDIWRANSSELSQKIMEEAKAGKLVASVADGSQTGYTLKKAGLSLAFDSPNLDPFPAELKDPDKKYVITHSTYQTVGYNTKLIPKAEAPRTYEDLLNPKWKGKMAWSTSDMSGGPGFVGIILTTYGQEKGMEYLKKLAQQNMINIDSANRAVVDRVIAGEYPMAVQISNHHTVISAKDGAPVDWMPLEPVTQTGSTMAILKDGPNPYSALLFVDFVLSKEGQAIYRDNDYLPNHPEVPAKVPALQPKAGNYKAIFISPDASGDHLEEWTKIYQQLFIK